MAYVPGHFDGTTWVKGHEAGSISKVIDHIKATGKLPNPPVKVEVPQVKIGSKAEVFHVEHPLTGQTMKTVEVAAAPQEDKGGLQERVDGLKGQLDAMMAKLTQLVG